MTVRPGVLQGAEFFILILWGFTILLYTSKSQTTTYYIGTLDSTEGENAGNVYLLSCREFLISDFINSSTTVRRVQFLAFQRHHEASGTLDGSGIELDQSHVNNSTDNNSTVPNILLTLPFSVKVVDLMLLYVWDPDEEETLAVLRLPKLLPNFVGPILKKPEGVSGFVWILNSKEIQISEFYFDSSGRASYFVVGTSADELLGMAHNIQANGRDGNLGTYRNGTFCMKLPESLAAFDVRYLAILDTITNRTYGHVEFPILADGTLAMQTYLEENGCITASCKEERTTFYDSSGTPQDILYANSTSTTSYVTNAEETVRSSLDHGSQYVPSSLDREMNELYNGYKGLKLGEIQRNPHAHNQHEIYGELYYANCKELVISRFTIKHPKRSLLLRFHHLGHIVRTYDNLKEYVDATVVIEIEVHEGHVIEVYDYDLEVVLAQFRFNYSMEKIAPFVQQLGPFGWNANGVEGTVFLLDERHVQIAGFHHDGGQFNASFYVGVGKTDQQEDGYAILDENGEVQQLSTYNGEDVCFTLPNNLTFLNITFISVRDLSSGKVLGEVVKDETSGYPPPSFGSNKCNTAIKEQCGVSGFLVKSNEPTETLDDLSLDRLRSVCSRNHQDFLISILASLVIFIIVGNVAL